MWILRNLKALFTWPRVCKHEKATYIRVPNANIVVKVCVKCNKVLKVS